MKVPKGKRPIKESGIQGFLLSYVVLVGRVCNSIIVNKGVPKRNKFEVKNQISREIGEKKFGLKLVKLELLFYQQCLIHCLILLCYFFF